MKRNLGLAGLSLVIITAVTLGQAVKRLPTNDSIQLMIVSQLKQQYQTHLDNVRIGTWATVPTAYKLSSPEERKQELQQIEQTIADSQNKQKQLSSKLLDKEQTIEAVQSDFAAGRLTRPDMDMLIQMFEQRRKQEQQQLSDEQNRVKELQSRKQQLQNYIEPDRLLVAEAQFEMGDLMVKRPVFMNQTENRPATEEEIDNNPNATEIQAHMPTTVSLAYNERPLIAGLFSIWGLIMGYMFFYTRSQKKNRQQVYYRTEVHRG